MKTWKKQFVALGLGIALTLGGATFANSCDEGSCDQEEGSYKEYFLESIKAYDISAKDKSKINDFLKEIDKIDEEKKSLDKKTDAKWEEISKILIPYEKDFFKKQPLPSFENFLKENEIKETKDKNVMETLKALYKKLTSYKNSGDFEKYDETYFDILGVCNEGSLFIDIDNEELKFDYEKNPLDEVLFYDIDDFIKEKGSKIKKEDVASLKKLKAEMKQYIEKKDSKKLDETFKKIDHIFGKYE